MGHWKTTLTLNHENGEIKTDDEISIVNGIFKGDSYSPLLFCIVLSPLSYQLKMSSCGYEVYSEKVTHLFFVDDLKIYGRNNAQLETFFHTASKFSRDIKMESTMRESNFCKCSTHKLYVEIDSDTTIKELSQEKFYKYLGVN